ncbi:YbaB/EbfC family DNA-binding protein [Amycolatopsis sp. GM8]|uniref:YbaB/EbfC family DNA-binding protein n=1 Tax=Amycolatopsis sp. GM8 TaxID=2896530 RepID=UPI001F2DEA59|nr:YbaB/EbfC family DNA-binding protein [Amycolatopsis sp. GM8]
MIDFGEIVGKATADGVTVEVGVGGRLRTVKLDAHAMRNGAGYLANTVVSVAARATARANQRAQQVYAQTLGQDATKVGDALGLGYDPELASDDDFDRDWTRG